MSGSTETPTGVPAPEIDLRDDLDAVEQGLREAVEAGQPMVHEAAGHVLASGGKRFRPMLVLLAGRLGQYDAHRQELIDCAIAIELTHLATLYHDDVMDEADVRRGHSSANARFDNRVAILAGDWLFARSSSIASQLGTYPSKVLADTIGAVCEGQIMESEHTGTPNQNVDRYLATIQRKTAALLATSCHLGAWIAGCTSATVNAVTAFGDALGTAFQVYDDVLDIAGVAEESGKIPGTDLREGVWTLPVLDSLSSGDAELRAALERSDVPAAIEILRGNGSIERATATAGEWSARAVFALDVVPAGPVRASLEQLAQFVVARTA